MEELKFGSHFGRHLEFCKSHKEDSCKLLVCSIPDRILNSYCNLKLKYCLFTLKLLSEPFIRWDFWDVFSQKQPNRLDPNLKMFHQIYFAKLLICHKTCHEECIPAKTVFVAICFGRSLIFQ